MATLHPFRALRPNAANAPRIAAVPYDVVNTDEARALADGNPLSFLRVSRAEIELQAGSDPYADAVYQRAADNFATLRTSALTVEDEASVYGYRLQMGSHIQTGLAACFSIDEYDRDIIKKHERTRRDKEDDRTKHMIALGAQTGPVFLTYRAADVIDSVVARVTAGEPIIDFTAPDEVRHTLWRVGGADRDALVAAVGRIPALYIADGHHRAASAARARTEMRERGIPGTSLGNGADKSTMLAVAFPHDQVQILPYNRTVKDLAGLTPESFLHELRARFTVDAGPAALRPFDTLRVAPSPVEGREPQGGPEHGRGATPQRRGDIAMYFKGAWYTLRPRVAPDSADPIGSLDVSVLQERLLGPVLKIADVRTDKRIDFVAGARGTSALAQAVDSGKAAVAFSLFPVSVADLMAVSDAGEIMPPKSTWFEPKLRDGLLIHLI